MCVQMICTHACGGQRLVLHVFLDHFTLYVLRNSLLLESPVLLVWPAGFFQQSHLPTPDTGTTAPQVSTGTGNLNSGFHTGVASALATKTYLQPS